MIGIIFHHKKLKRIVHNQESYENTSFYFQLAEKNEIDLFFYTVSELLSNHRKIKGYKYSYQDKKLMKTVENIPKVNLLRTIIRRKYIYHKLKKLEEKQQFSFINMIPGRNKLKIYDYLSTFKQHQAYIPETRRLSYANLCDFIRKFNVVVIKPISGARGEKIYRISKEKNEYSIQYVTQQKQHNMNIKPNQLRKFLKKYIKYPSLYLVQRWIDFRQLDGDKFDLRVSVQKDKQGLWNVTGIVARAASNNGIVTNIAQGGRAVSFQKLNSVVRENMLSEIKKISLDIAKSIEKLYPATADLGLDLAIDQEDKIWFIEANHCDERYSYYESKDLDMWQASYFTPFEYAYAEYSKRA